MSTLQSAILAFYTTTTIGAFRWTYLVLLNLSEEAQGYSLDLEPFLEDKEKLVYDYLAGQSMRQRQVVGSARSGEIRYLVLPAWAGTAPAGLLGQICHPVWAASQRDTGRARACRDRLGIACWPELYVDCAERQQPRDRGRGLSNLAVEGIRTS